MVRKDAHPGGGASQFAHGAEKSCASGQPGRGPGRASPTWHLPCLAGRRIPMKIAVLGGGGLGTCLARVFASRHHEVTLWIRNAERRTRTRSQRENRVALPGVLLPETVTVAGVLDRALEQADLVVLAVPCPSLRALCKVLRLRLTERAPVLVATRGFDAGGIPLPLDLAAEALALT